MKYLKFLKTTKRFYKNINWSNKEKQAEIRNAWLEIMDYKNYSLTSHFFSKQKLLYKMKLQKENKNARNNSYDYWTMRGWSEEVAKLKVFEIQSNNTKRGITRLGCSTSSKKYLELHGLSKDDIDVTMKSRKRFSFSDLDKETHMEYSKKGSEKRIEQISFLRETNPQLLKEQFNNTIEFYISRGYSLEESTILLKNRQTTFSLEKLKEKYDEKDALLIFNNRQDKWQTTLSLKSETEKKEINLKKAINLENLQRKYGSEMGLEKYIAIMENRKAVGSKEADNFFKMLLTEIDFIEEPYWSQGQTGNEYFLYDKENNKFYFYDFTLKSKKVIIEYHGESFHPRKDKLSLLEWNSWKVPFTNETANSKYAFDQRKKQFAEKNGFTVIEIWSSDEFAKSLEKIVKYLYNKKGV